MAKKKSTPKKKVAKKADSKAKQPKQVGKDAKRKANGQFGEGNNAGDSHKDPAGSLRREFKRWFKEAITKEHIESIAKNLVAIATNTDSKASVQAAKEILDRCMGKAEQPINIGGSDGGPLPPITVIVKNEKVKD